MGTFLSAYLIVWSVLTGYVFWLRGNQRNLERWGRSLGPSMGESGRSLRWDSSVDEED